MERKSERRSKNAALFLHLASLMHGSLGGSFIHAALNGGIDQLTAILQFCEPLTSWNRGKPLQRGGIARWSPRDLFVPSARHTDVDIGRLSSCCVTDLASHGVS